MGGPASFTDDVLQRAHAPLKIDGSAFDEMIALYEETLSKPMEIPLCDDTYELIKNDFQFTVHGEVQVKGFEPKNSTPRTRPAASFRCAPTT